MRKRFGQNFLKDQNIIDNIVNLIDPQVDDCMLEIGPGTGAITSKLLEKLKILYAVEIDRELTKELINKFPDLVIFRQDILKFNFANIPCNENIRLVGNLPYNISSPILFHFLNFRSKITDMHFMLQLELADRIVSKPHNKIYGRLSVMLQTFCEVEKLLIIKPQAFYPRPKVNSAIIRIKPKTISNINFNKFSLLVKTAFGKRRKTLRNNLKTIIPKNYLPDAPFDLSLRAENIEVTEYLKIFNWFDSIKQ